MKFKVLNSVPSLVVAFFATPLFSEFSERIGTIVFPILLMLVAMSLDFITGICAAPYRGEVVTSNAFWVGLKKKGMMLMIFLSGIVLDGVLFYFSQIVEMNTPKVFYVSLFVAAWLTINEILSLLENVQDAGISFPPFLQKITQSMKNSIEETMDNKEEEKNEPKIDSSHK